MDSELVKFDDGAVVLSISGGSPPHTVYRVLDADGVTVAEFISQSELRNFLDSRPDLTTPLT